MLFEYKFMVNRWIAAEIYKCRVHSDNTYDIYEVVLMNNVIFFSPYSRLVNT